MTETGRAGERRGHALIEDITYAGPEGSTVEAYLITPSSTGSPSGALGSNQCQNITPALRTLGSAGDPALDGVIR